MIEIEFLSLDSIKWTLKNSVMEFPCLSFVRDNDELMQLSEMFADAGMDCDGVTPIERQANLLLTRHGNQINFYSIEGTTILVLITQQIA